MFLPLDVAPSFSLADLVLAGVGAGLGVAFLAGRYWRSREVAAMAREGERYRLLAEHASDMLSTHGPDGAFLYVSPALEQLLGASTAELVGRSPAEFVHPDDLHRAIAATQQTLTTGAPAMAAWRCRRWDGAYVWLETSGRVVQGGGLSAPRFVCATRDITARKGVETALRDSERRFRETLEMAHLVAFALDIGGRVTFANDSLLLLTGWSRQELVGGDWFARCVSDGGGAQADFVAAMETGILAAQQEYELVCRDGRRRLIAWDCTVLRDPSGTVMGAACLGADVTERREKEIALHLLHQITLAMGNAESYDAALAVMLESLATAASWPYAEVWEPAGNERLERVASHGTTPLLARPSAAGSQHDGSLPDAAWKARGTVWREDLTPGSSGPPPTPPSATPATAVAVPVFAADAIVAVLSFSLPHRRPIDDRFARVITTVARQLGATILRQKAESALRLEQERFRHAFEHSSIGLALVAPDGHWLRVNTALCDIVGYSEQELLSSSFQDITHAEDLAADVAHVQLLLSGAGDSYRMEKRYLHQAGHIVWAMLTASLVRDAEGRALFFVSQIQDITHSKRYEQAILEARDAAEESNRAKSAFLASMSHELRTPLNAVIGFSRVLKRNRTGNLQPDEMKLLERIELNGQHLLALISDILDLSKIEAGHLDIQLRPVGIAALVTEVLAQVDVTATSKGLRLETVLPANAEPVMLDAMRFKQVLLNLVGNAVKFSERGVITVALHVENGGTRPTHLTVSDTGIGIPADRLQAVFEPFEQAEVGTSRKYGGTGLGLPISRTLCEAMGLRLAATSTAGAGSTFTIWFDAKRLVAAA